MNIDLARLLTLTVSSVFFSLIGVFTFLVSFYVVDKLTPGDLWQELVEKKNTAVGVFFGLLALGICLIIAACLHG
jgi:putative membrane protein